MIAQVIGQAMDAHQKWAAERTQALEAVEIAQQELDETPLECFPRGEVEVMELARTLAVLRNDIQGFKE